MSASALLAERATRQFLARPTLRSPVDVVRRLGALQAQDYGGAKWGIGQRARGTSDAAVEGALDRGAIVRTHVLRPTWHFVAAEDVRWMLALTAPRIHAAAAGRRRALGVDAALLRTARKVVERALRDGDHRTRRELGEAMAAAGIAPQSQRLAHLMQALELDAVVCSGARRDGSPTYALMDLRVPKATGLAGDDALVELARRYFTTRDPATERDFAWWAGLTLGDARRGCQAVRAGIRRIAPAPLPRALLLSTYDEYFSSYTDRDAMIGPAARERIGAQGSVLQSVVAIDGCVAGTWSRAPASGAFAVEIHPFRRLSAAERAAVEEAAGRQARFLGRDYLPNSCTVSQAVSRRKRARSGSSPAL